ncbi:MAG: hypothetical protein D3909_07870 [Candidatus Electrothrix sp. ATG1]|nr:hypothetical protein [Candidatus Electrothrix sp. ATG1]
MDPIIGFFIYALTFRLAIITAGIVSIVLGYKLFVRGVAPEGGTDVNAEAGPSQVKLTFHNAGPGLGFALFGAVVIGIMLFQGNPSFFMEFLMNNQSNASSPKMEVTAANQPSISHSEQKEISGTVRIRGEHDGLSIDQEWDKLDKPNVTLAEAAEPLSKIARVWQKTRTGEAVAMARLAAFYCVEKNKANYWSLFAETLFENGDEKKAITAMQEAAERDPLYRSALAKMQQGLEGRQE